MNEVGGGGEREQAGEKGGLPATGKTQQGRRCTEAMPPPPRAALTRAVREISHSGPSFQARHFAEDQMHPDGYFHGNESDLHLFIQSHLNSQPHT